MAPPSSRASCWAAGLISVLSIGCASPPRIDYSPEAFRNEVVRRTPELRRQDVIVPFEVDAGPIAKARELMVDGREGADRVDALVRSLSDPDGFALHYQWAASGTASETLARHVGNCFALSSVLVGLARGVGLRAYYVEVVLNDPRWHVQKDVAVQADHIAAVIETASGRVYVDFSGRLDRAQSVRVISDMEALAHFYNNRGYERIDRAERTGEDIDWSDVIRSFEIATRVHPGMARAWNNLGVARSRLGDVEGARRAYQTALEHESRLQAAHVNLAMLDMREGAFDDAALHLRTARALDPRNPQVEELIGRLPSSQRNPDDALGG